MNSVEIRGLRIGEGIPKICVPLVSANVDQLREDALEAVKAGADLVEWRMDWFEAWSEERLVQEALAVIRNALGEIPLLATFRTKEEGGQRVVAAEQYYELYRTVLHSGKVDLIDLELYFDCCAITELIREVRETNVKLVLSNHDFEKTPEKDELVKRLCEMADMGADIAKIAVMPQSPKDVAVLLMATAEAKQRIRCPIITMSMGGQGVISRMAGQIFGSAVTFGALEKLSAPGQIPVEQLKEVLQLVDSLQ